MPKVKLHRCPFTFVHNNLDSCWKVQHALDQQGIAYEVIKEPLFPRSRRMKASDLPSGEGVGRIAPPGPLTNASTSPLARSSRWMT